MVLRPALLLGLVVGGLFAAGAAGGGRGDRVVVIVRHAETEGGGSDPALSAAGRQRADALARIAAAHAVEAAFATPFRRTQGTAAPAADWLGLRTVVVPIDAGVPAHIADLAGRVRRASGAGVLVVGHSNTVPELVFALTGQTVGPIGETQYHRLFVVRLPAAGPATVEERTY